MAARASARVLRCIERLLVVARRADCGGHRRDGAACGHAGIPGSIGSRRRAEDRWIAHACAPGAVPMTSRPRPPFRADHVGSFLRPEVPSRRPRPGCQGRDHARRAARGGRPRDHRHREVPAGRGPAEHHRRRVPPHLLPHRFPGAARRREVRSAGDGEEARRQRGAGAARDARGRQGAPCARHPACRLRVPEEPGGARPHAEGDDPVADDAALPRRPGGHQPRGLSRAGARVLRGRGEGLRRRAALAVRRGLPLRADGRHQPGLPLRRQDARGGARPRRRSRRAAAPLRRRSSTAWWRASPRA